MKSLSEIRTEVGSDQYQTWDREANYAANRKPELLNDKPARIKFTREYIERAYMQFSPDFNPAFEHQNRWEGE